MTHVTLCRERRKDEMIALLNAGASTYAKDENGFSAIGFLTMDKVEKPNLDMIRTFMNHHSKPDIDYMQGPEGMASTALAFACQNNWKELVKLYLELSANPVFVRTSDNFSSLAICAAKGFTGLVAIILEKSKHQLDTAYGFALRAARQYGHKHIVQLILKKTGGVEPEDCFTFARGTPLEDLFSLFSENKGRLTAPATVSQLESPKPG